MPLEAQKSTMYSKEIFKKTQRALQHFYKSKEKIL
jgi:hypothetical protein